VLEDEPFVRISQTAFRGPKLEPRPAQKPNRLAQYDVHVDRGAPAPVDDEMDLVPTGGSAEDMGLPPPHFTDIMLIDNHVVGTKQV
jgi:hypothetical protein